MLGNGAAAYEGASAPAAGRRREGFNNMARTYTTRMGALKKYRAKAQQAARVERATVEESAQAIVGHDAYQTGAD